MKKLPFIAFAIILITSLTSCAKKELLVKVNEHARYVSVTPPGPKNLHPCAFCQDMDCYETPWGMRCECILVEIPEMEYRRTFCVPAVKIPSSSSINDTIRDAINEMYFDTVGYGLIPIINSFHVGTPDLSVNDWHSIRDTFLFNSDKGKDWLDVYYAMSIIAIDSNIINSTNALDHYIFWTGFMNSMITMANGDSADIVFSSSFKSIGTNMMDLYMSKTNDPYLTNPLYTFKNDLDVIEGMTKKQVYDYYNP
jgi:hypothetical protein